MIGRESLPESLGAAEYSIGEWRIIPALNRLRGPEGDRQLEPQTMRVLLALIFHAGEVLTRQQLHDLAWGGASVSDESLSRAIFDLRKALGDRAGQPRYIETIRKVGYRLIAPVTEHTAPATSDAEPAESSTTFGALPEGPGSRWPVGMTVIALALILVVAGFLFKGLGFTLDPAPDPDEINRPVTPELGGLEQRPEIEQLTSYPGIETHAAVSPDGESLAFSWDGEAGDAEIYWRPLDRGAPIRLTDHPARDDSPVFSPEGSRIVFVRHSAELCELRSTPVPDGRDQDAFQDEGETGGGSVPPDQSVLVAKCLEAGVSSPVWWRDFLIFADRDAPDEPYRLHRLDLDNLEVAAISSPPFGSFGDLYPAISESGERLAFLRATAQSTISTYLTPAIGDIYVAELSSTVEAPLGESDQRLRRLTFDNQLVAGIAWSGGEHALVYAAQTRDQGYGLWQVDATGTGVPKLWVSDLGGLLRLPRRVGAAGFAYERWDGRTDIFQVFFDGSEERKIQASTRSDLNPRWHPAGDRIAFTSARTGSYEIWTDRIAGGTGVELGAERRTSKDGSPAESPAWSPDGRLLTFEARTDGHSHLYVIDGASQARQLTSSVFDDRSPAFAVDGEAIYFASNRSGSWQIWRLELGVDADGRVTPGKASQVTRGGGFRALEGLVDGEAALFYSKRDDGGVWRWHPEDGESLVAPLAPEHWGNWDLVGGKLYSVELTEDRTSKIFSQDLSTGDRVVEAVVPGWISRETPNLSIAPDGESALITRFSGLAADLLLVRPHPETH